MNRGTILLWADSALESKIITSFLQAADFEVINYSGNKGAMPTRVDVAVIVLDHPDSDLARATDQVRRAISQNPPIVAVVMQVPDVMDSPGRVLLRPICLFDLTQAIEELIHTNRSDSYSQATIKQSRG